MNCSATVLEDFLGEEVVDTDGNPVGTLACYWEYRQRNALLLGVDIPGRPGHTHIVPAQGARCSERQTYVKVPFTREKIVQAPCLPCESEMDETFEERIWAFYELPAPRPADSSLLSQKIEGMGSQLRRVAQPATRPAHCATSPAPSTTPGAEIDLAGPGRETPAAPGSHVPGTTSPSEES